MPSESIYSYQEALLGGKVLNFFNLFKKNFYKYLSAL